uniref:Uncharacterized protein n=1 Tax=Arundo donax TaxID=35708 RepID=A0A0A9HMI9_ARUDO
MAFSQVKGQGVVDFSMIKPSPIAVCMCHDHFQLHTSLLKFYNKLLHNFAMSSLYKWSFHHVLIMVLRQPPLCNNIKFVFKLSPTL